MASRRRAAHTPLRTSKQDIAAVKRAPQTLRDFVGGDGKPGYFQQKLFVYGRGGEACRVCKSALTERRLGQRSTVFCRQCQH